GSRARSTARRARSSTRSSTRSATTRARTSATRPTSTAGPTRGRRGWTILRVSDLGAGRGLAQVLGRRLHVLAEEDRGRAHAVAHLDEDVAAAGVDAAGHAGHAPARCAVPVVDREGEEGVPLRIATLVEDTDPALGWGQARAREAALVALLRGERPHQRALDDGLGGLLSRRRIREGEGRERGQGERGQSVHVSSRWGR